MGSDDLDWLDRDDLDSLEIVERVMAREIADVDAADPDAGDDNASLVRNGLPQQPRGSSGAATKLKDED